MASRSVPTEPQRPGRLRLAAALGGAGVLAVGLGSGVLDAAGQDAAGAGAAPGETALGPGQPVTAAANETAPATDSAPAPTVSSTPLNPPASEPAAPVAAAQAET